MTGLGEGGNTDGYLMVLVGRTDTIPTPTSISDKTTSGRDGYICVWTGRSVFV